MESIPYIFVVGCLMYTQTFIRLDISFDVGIIGGYESNLHWTTKKLKRKVFSYLQGTKDHMLTCRRSDHLEVVGYSNSDCAGCVDSRKSHSVTCFCYLEEQFHGRVESSPSLSLLPCRLNLWHVLRPLFMGCGYGTLSWDLEYSTILSSR